VSKHLLSSSDFYIRWVIYHSSLWKSKSTPPNYYFSERGHLLPEFVEQCYRGFKWIIFADSFIVNLKVEVQWTTFFRFHRFYKQLISSKRPEVLHLMRLQQCDARSTFGRNCRNLGISMDSPDPFGDLIHLPPEQDEWKVPMLKELIQCRAGRAEIAVLDRQEIDFLIRDICCT